MDFTEYTSPGSADVVPEEEGCSTSLSDDHETTCWGCGLHVLVSPYASVFKCGWCGAITNQNAPEHNDKNFRWRRLRDWCLLNVVLMFMLFFISGGFWAVYPVVFSMSVICGMFHLTVAVILSICTLSTFVLAAFRPAGAPPTILWGSYPTVGKGGLENYTFCHYCSKPKSPRTHHCRSCGKCILDMDHHCPFIGNCVGAANHRWFILFLISTITSMFYVTGMSIFAAHHIWSPLNLQHSPVSLWSFANRELFFEALKEICLVFLRSMVFVSSRGLVLGYLFIASVALEIGLCVLLWQQLCFIYEGKTYLSHLNAADSEEAGERDCQNLVRFFGCPYTRPIYLPSFFKSRKAHKK